MSDRIRSITLFTALLLATACGGGSDTPSGAATSPTSAAGATGVTPATSGATPAAPAAVCGNGKIEGTEMCDGADLGGKTCASLVPGSTGMPMCNNCKIDMLLCLMPPKTAGAIGGAGAAQGGSGARTTGAAGAGGSGR
jgi:hypothetical protein